MNGMERGRVPAFCPDAFEVTTLDQAMRVTVTPEPGTTTEERWQKETVYLLEDICRFLPLRPESCLLDYGCGTGRVSKALIDKVGCRALGVDANKSMRLLAPEYVLSERFNVWSPEILEHMLAKGFRADFAMCLWVIQHAVDPMHIISQISRALPPGGLLYCLNSHFRCVPTDQGWCDDGFDIRSALCQAFQEEEMHALPNAVTTPHLASITMIQILRKR